MNLKEQFIAQFNTHEDLIEAVEGLNVLCDALYETLTSDEHTRLQRIIKVAAGREMDAAMAHDENDDYPEFEARKLNKTRSRRKLKRLILQVHKKKSADEDHDEIYAAVDGAETGMLAAMHAHYKRHIGFTPMSRWDKPRIE